MAGKILEFVFPRSYLVDYVEGRVPNNGKIKGLFNGRICDKTIACDSLTQRMLLITSNISTVEFSFGKNPWEIDMPLPDQLLYLRLNELEVVSNCSEAHKDFLKLSVTLCKDHPYFTSIRVQCVLSLQKNPNNVKHICYLEVTSPNSTAIINGEVKTGKDGMWYIGKKLVPTEKDVKLGYGEYYVFNVEEVKGPFMFTGVGIDSYAGFVFQIARIDDAKKGKLLIDECFYESDSRLTAADFTHCNYFESGRKDQTGYKESGHSTHIVRNFFREIAMEDKQVAILLQKLNHFYPEFTTNPVSKVLPSMLDILERCFADNQISLIQSVIRVNHIKSDEEMINPPVRQIWSTFSASISLVKQFVLQRPNLNMLECAILSDDKWDKLSAFGVALSQCFIAYILASHVLNPETEEYADSVQCDIISIINDVFHHPSDICDCILKCYWRVDFSFMMTLIAVVISTMKVYKQAQDQYKFYVIFKKLIKRNPSLCNVVLLFLDCFVNVILSFLTVILTFFLISSADEATDLVLNCLAITFIVELDEDLNHRDPVEVNDLVIQSFKKYLINDMMDESDDISQHHNGCIIQKDNSSFQIFKENAMNLLLFDFKTLESTQCHKKVVDYKNLLKQLKSADYSSDSKSLNERKEILGIVQSYINDRRRFLPILNDKFKGDPDPGKPKYLVLRFNNHVTINVREKLVVDFEVVEGMLKHPNGTTYQKSERIVQNLITICAHWLKVCYIPSVSGNFPLQ